ncbi:MAG: hypothetical protein D4R73_02930 [Deltaproteobacteria bacterium]|nr:MAG: hypothetical protein D4R73_02930 [Deltaproteobacteria bacterium]
MLSFEAWAGRSGQLQIFLISTSVMRVADGVIIPLYFSDYPPDRLSRFYLPCIKDMPRLTRQSNDTLTPNHVPTWGDLTLWAKDLDYKPDGANSISWREMLSGAYTFIGQPLVIKVGGEEFAEADYYTLFTGHIGRPSWDEGEGTVTLRIYDKGKELDRTIPDFELPESPYVDEGSWNQLIPLPLGAVKNFKPILIRQTEAGAFLYALAGAVIDALDNVYYNAAAAGGGSWTFKQKDISPAAKDAEGSATMETSGPYTGDAMQEEWIIQIDSIAAGSEVGLATFRYSIDGGETWLGEGILTWKLAYDATTLVKSPAAGNATMVVSGDYTGTTKDTYKVKVTRGGHIGDVPCPQFEWSDDNGANWNGPVDILATAPIALNRGLSVAFTGAPGSGTWIENSWWTPIASAPGVMGVVAHNHGDNVDVEITTSGNVGDAVRFKWRNNGGAWHLDNSIPNINPIELFAGYSVQFTDPPLTDPPVNDYDAGDVGGSTSVYVAPFVVDDIWSWTFKEAPIPLADGVSIQFYTQSGQDFEALDEWRFRLISTVLCSGLEETTDVTVDCRGMIDPVSLAYVDKAADIIRALIAVWAGWDPEAEFDLAALAAFNATIPYKLGLLVDSPSAISEIIDTLLSGIPAVYTVTLNGKFFLKEITNPAGEPSLSLTDVEYFPSRTGEKDDQNFYRRVYLHYDRNWNTNQNAAGVSQERLQWLRREWRQISRHNQDLEDSKEAHDLGPLDTCLIDRDEAALLAQKNIDLYGTRRETQQVETKIQPFQRNIWDTVEIDGLPFALKGLELDMYDRSILTVWR